MIKYVTMTGSGTGQFFTIFTDGTNVCVTVSGGNSCFAGHRNQAEKLLGAPCHKLKELYECKKHNIIAKKLTGKTIQELKNSYSE